MVSRSVRRRVTGAQSTGRQVADSTLMAGLARAGLLARGVMYALIGIIAIQIALGSAHRQADRSGAVRLVDATPFGSVILWLMVAGFIGLTLWRLSEAIWGAAGPEGRKASTRLTSLLRAVLYGFISYGILRFALGLGAPPSTNKQSRDLTAVAFKHSGGQILVAIAGVLILGAGLYLAYQAYRAKFLRDMRLGAAAPRTRSVVTRLGQIGGVSRGAVFACIGVFLLTAAIDAKPGQAKGIDSALREFAKTPLGPWLLGLVAFGLVLFGIFSCCEARWRRV